MAEYAITGDVATLLGGDHNTGDPAALWVEASQPILIVDSEGRTGGKLRVDLADDGTFTVTGLPETVSGATPLYRLHVDSLSLRLAGKRNGTVTGWFPLTTDRDLEWIVNNYVETSLITAQVATNVAAAAALGATNDTATASYVPDTGSATRAALETWAEPFVREGDLVNNVRDFGAVGDGAANDTAAIQAAIDAGGITYFPPGIYSCKGLVAPATGMNLLGATHKGAGRSILVGGVSDTTPILTTSGIAYDWTITNLAFESAPSGGPCMSGEWALGVIRGCQFDQPNNGQSAITVTVWIDCSIEGYTVFNHVLGATAPTFKALSAVGDVAQLTFQDLRFNNSGNYNIWLEATSSQMIYNVRIVNVNFEVPSGGAINLLSCRNVTIENCGMWDMAVAASKPMINASKSTGADNRFITVRNYMRDASTAPSGYDMVFASTANLVLDSCGHPTTNITVNAGSSTGRVMNSPGATVDNATNMSTDQFQTRTPTISGTGTALGNGTLTSRYRRSGNTVDFTVRWILGSTSTVGSGGVTFSLSPVPANANWHYGLQVQFTDVSAGTSTPGQALLTASGVQVYSSTYGAVNATAPFTWATGDVIQVSGSYEVAT